MNGTISNSCDYVEVELKHPLQEIDKITLFAFNINNSQILFSIPQHSWSYFMDMHHEFTHKAPRAFRYNEDYLTQNMKGAIKRLKAE